jgi:hypothetical protein
LRRHAPSRSSPADKNGASSGVTVACRGFVLNIDNRHGARLMRYRFCRLSAVHSHCSKVLPHTRNVLGGTHADRCQCPVQKISYGENTASPIQRLHHRAGDCLPLLRLWTPPIPGRSPLSFQLAMGCGTESAHTRPCHIEAMQPGEVWNFYSAQTVKVDVCHSICSDEGYYKLIFSTTTMGVF